MINHENENYICQQISQKCKFIGYKHIQKVRIGKVPSPEQIDNLKRMLLYEPSEDLIKELYDDDDIADLMDKMEYFDQAGTNPKVFQSYLDQLSSLLEKNIKIEKMKFMKYIEIHFDGRQKPKPEILNDILEDNEVIEAMRVITGPDWEIKGLEAWKVVEKRIKQATKGHRGKNDQKCIIQ